MAERPSFDDEDDWVGGSRGDRDNRHRDSDRWRRGGGGAGGGARDGRYDDEDGGEERRDSPGYGRQRRSREPDVWDRAEYNDREDWDGREQGRYRDGGRARDRERDRDHDRDRGGRRDRDRERGRNSDWDARGERMGCEATHEYEASEPAEDLGRDHRHRRSPRPDRREEEWDTDSRGRASSSSSSRDRGGHAFGGLEMRTEDMHDLPAPRSARDDRDRQGNIRSDDSSEGVASTDSRGNLKSRRGKKLRKPRPPDLEGELLKLKHKPSILGGYNKRYFRVNKEVRTLEYFQSAGIATRHPDDPTCSIPLEDITSVNEFGDESLQIESPHRTLCVRAESAAVRACWANGLQTFVQEMKEYREQRVRDEAYRREQER